MIESKHEFETIPAFTVIAGDDGNESTQREVIFSLVKGLGTISSDSGITHKYFKLLAEYSDDELESGIGEDLKLELIDCMNDIANLPDSCSITWRNGEVIVLPFIDDEIPRYDEIPWDSDNQKDINPNGDTTIYVINDHGNISCFTWADSGIKDIFWEFQWDMV